MKIEFPGLLFYIGVGATLVQHENGFWHVLWKYVIWPADAAAVLISVLYHYPAPF